MAISIALSADLKTATVTSDRRKFTLSATSGQETATADAVWPVIFVDDSGHTWTKGADDGLKAVYTY